MRPQAELFPIPPELAPVWSSTDPVEDIEPVRDDPQDDQWQCLSCGAMATGPLSPCFICQEPVCADCMEAHRAEHQDPEARAVSVCACGALSVFHCACGSWVCAGHSEACPVCAEVYCYPCMITHQCWRPTE